MRSYDVEKGASYLVCRIFPAQTTTPTTSNDLSQGFAVGDIWLIPTASSNAGNAYMCVSNAAGAAVWTRFGSL